MDFINTYYLCKFNSTCGCMGDYHTCIYPVYLNINIDLCNCKFVYDPIIYCNLDKINAFRLDSICFSGSRERYRRTKDQYRVNSMIFYSRFYIDIAKYYYNFLIISVSLHIKNIVIQVWLDF